MSNSVSKTILVIEDDASVAQMLKDVLQDEGFDVILEPNGEYGLRLFETKPIDLLILDVLIPQLQGFELLTKLRAMPEHRELPVIVISGVYRSATYKTEIQKRHKIVEYFDKPVDIDRLIDALHDVFSSAYPEPKASAKPRGTGGLLKEEDLAAMEAPEEERANLPTKGSFENLPFARLLGLAFSAKVTGSLMLSKDSIKKLIHFKEGIPVFIKSNLLSECLGRVMIEERLISAEECEAALGRQRAEQKRLGQTLIGMGSISAHNLEYALEVQMQNRLFETFSWHTGEFQFSAQTVTDSPQIALSMSPTEMIHEGAGRAMSTGQVLDELQVFMNRAVIASGDPTLRYQALQLDPRGEHLLDRIDGQRTLFELLESAQFERADAALLMYALSCTGLIRFIDPDDIFAVMESPEPISIGDDDMEALSTGEINTIAELAKVTEEDLMIDVDDVDAVPSEEVQERLLEALRGGVEPDETLPKPRFEALLNEPATTLAPPPPPPEVREVSESAAIEVPESLQRFADESDEPEPQANGEAEEAEPIVEVSEPSVMESSSPKMPVLDEVSQPSAPASDALPLEAIDLDEFAPDVLSVPEPAPDALEPDALDSEPLDSDVLSPGASAQGGFDMDPPTPELVVSEPPAATGSGPSKPVSAPLEPKPISKIPRARAPSVLPRKPRWEPKVSTNPSLKAPPPPEPEAVTQAPALSSELRLQVRARLEAEIERLAVQRNSERVSAMDPLRTGVFSLGEKTGQIRTDKTLKVIPKRAGAGRSMVRGVSATRFSTQREQQEQERAERTLSERYQELRKKTHYELLGVHRTASKEEIQKAYNALAPKLEPEQLDGSNHSQRARKLGEQIFLLAVRALNTLTHPEAKKAYDRAIGTDGEVRLASVLAADELFERGRAAEAEGDWISAMRAYEEAMQLSPREGLYPAAIARVLFDQSPDDKAARQKALELLERAAEHSPRHEEVYLLQGRVHQKGGNKSEATRAYDRALKCNPDCVPALEALQALAPPNVRKTGFLSRLGR